MKRELSVCLSTSMIQSFDLKNKIVVVVDIFRAKIVDVSKDTLPSSSATEEIVGSIDISISSTTRR